MHYVFTAHLVGGDAEHTSDVLLVLGHSLLAEAQEGWGEGAGRERCLRDAQSCFYAACINTRGKE